MGLFKSKKNAKKPASKATKKNSSSEAKAVLAKMKAKKDAGECAFC